MIDPDKTVTNTYVRGLKFHEVAFIKAMSQRDFRRDYIMSFLLYPGRTLSPACINDVVDKDRAPEVPPAAWEECEALMARRMSESQSADDDFTSGPLSAFAIHQELGFVISGQNSLFGHEGTRLEFKRQLPDQDKSLSRVLKTMAAMTNRAGGYVVFGIADDRTLVGIQPGAWDNFDWDAFSSRLASLFQPSIVWRRRMLEFEGVKIGAVYIFPAGRPPCVSTKDWHDIAEGTIYFRRPGVSDRIAYGDLLDLLARRDATLR